MNLFYYCGCLYRKHEASLLWELWVWCARRWPGTTIQEIRQGWEGWYESWMCLIILGRLYSHLAMNGP